jgi:glycogen(starch) synthase
VRILHLSWEYPPVVYGGLGRHVHALAEHQAALGHEVVVLTQAAPRVRADEVVNGVRVIRVNPDPPNNQRWQEDFLAWAFGFNVALARAVPRLASSWRPDVLHGHDWLVAQAAVIGTEVTGIPLTITFHATEHGRQGGELSTAFSQAVDATERWMAAAADGIIVCSSAMSEEVRRIFGRTLPVTVIPNGIDPGHWHVSPAARARVRRRYGTPLVVYTGRLEREKGVQTLIAAVGRMRRSIPAVRAVITGTGGAEDWLRAQVRRQRLSTHVAFAGWVNERDLRSLVAAADVAVVPSLYEPFGFVALEASALGTPVVASEVGGLAEIVDDGRTGLTFPAGDASALAAALIATVSDPDAAAARVSAAQEELLQRYGWDGIARRTVEAYALAGAESTSSSRSRGRRARQ